MAKNDLMELSDEELNQQFADADERHRQAFLDKKELGAELHRRIDTEASVRNEEVARAMVESMPEGVRNAIAKLNLLDVRAEAKPAG